MEKNPLSLNSGVNLLDEMAGHYLIEKELAGRLKNSSKSERRNGLYTSIYDELFARVPNHPQLKQKVDEKAKENAVNRQKRIILKYLKKGGSYLEIGPGDCCLAQAMHKHADKVYAVDVSNEITKGIDLPGNFELCISDGCSIPVRPGIVDVAFSNQLMEHLHPDDAVEQLGNIYSAMKDGGAYVCITPHRFSGPHDVSKYFDEVATGFHLKEYTVRELARLFQDTGFSRVSLLLRTKKWLIEVPVWIIGIFEGILNYFPLKMRKSAASLPGMRAIFFTTIIVGKK